MEHDAGAEGRGPKITCDPRVSVTPSSQSSEVDVLLLQIELAMAQTELARASGPHCPSGQLGGLGDAQVSLSSLAYCTKLLPVFNEEQPDDFLVTFERTA